MARLQNRRRGILLRLIRTASRHGRRIRCLGLLLLQLTIGYGFVRSRLGIRILFQRVQLLCLFVGGGFLFGGATGGSVEKILQIAHRCIARDV